MRFLASLGMSRGGYHGRWRKISRCARNDIKVTVISNVREKLASPVISNGCEKSKNKIPRFARNDMGEKARNDMREKARNDIVKSFGMTGKVVPISNVVRNQLLGFSFRTNVRNRPQPVISNGVRNLEG